ncbi:hypothetical protein FB567DRAFT_291625 [Paraphoma chrysanthemicola]|uniref:Uncharacterized protein n=1 Tax=Paraphoma chrysanthemicola TaxID=798071 RepID=A0A8K0R8Y3_9PLEO|nr:hypothetical protein FB567DRAFT_291625 [Paraphoma chrysanthemicola]
MADRRPLINESSDLSESAGSTPALSGLQFTDNPQTRGFTHIAPPTSPPVSRTEFSSFQSDATAVDTIYEEHEEGDVAHSFHRQSGGGLGIAPSYMPVQTARSVSIQSIPGRSAGPGVQSSPVRSPGMLSPPGSANPFADTFPRDSSTENTPDLRRDRYSPREDVGTFEDFRRGILKNARQSNASVDDYQQYIHDSDTSRLHGAPSIRSAKSAYENDFRPTHECPTARDFYQSRLTWLNVTIIIICVFSCVFSGIFVGLAIREPFWGRRITSQGPLTPANAVLLTTIFAKLIELSFVTSFVAFLGQVLSRRAFVKAEGRGVSLAELSIWRWVVQPGTLITHPAAAKYAAFSFLGIMGLLSAVLATLYSSASAALVQPTLRQGSWKDTVMSGRVVSDFANVTYIKNLCQTPIRTDMEYGGSTCLQIEHAGQGYHNYQRYLAEWDLESRRKNTTTNQHKRPPGFGLLYENTTITAQWINIADTKAVSKAHGRAINNVSLAMPHAGVFEAAHSIRNDILQPEELNGEGTYSLRASVPSPVMNVLCVNMNKEELAPIVFDTWNPNTKIDIANWKDGGLMDNATTTNKTVVDDIFGWNSEERINYPPVFPKYPKPFNTIMNHTSKPWGRAAIYLLGQGGADEKVNMTGTYSLCRIYMSISPGCLTSYHAQSGGGSMEALCEDKADELSYDKHHPGASWVRSVPNWKDIGFDWSNALSLQTGIVDADASNSRLLTQLMLNPSNPDPNNLEVDLNPDLPSMGEAIAVMSGCTMLKSMMDAPFVMKWNYSDTGLDAPVYQYFNSSLMAQQYASGGIESPAAIAWVIVLVLVFLMNVFVLGYFLIHRGLVTDFSEPPNLFALAVNSPPSHVLAGSCGGGPEGRQYEVNWFVNHEGSHLFMEPGEKSALLAYDQSPSRMHGPVEELGPSPAKSGGGFVANMISTIRRGLGMKDKPPTKLRSATGAESLRHVQSRPVSIMSEYELQEGHERTRKQYAKLANRNRRSLL